MVSPFTVYRLPFIILLLTYSLTHCLYAQKEAKASIETKIALETNLENRLKKVLTEITGTEKIIVIVNVELMSEKKEKATEKKDDNILPGVPLKETMAEKKVESVMLSALGEDTRTLIKKLSVTIILDKSISAAVVEVVKKVANGLLGIDEERGDELIIQQMHFQKNPFYWGSIVYPPNIYWVVGILAVLGFALSISFFLFGPFQKFAKEIVSVAISSVAALKEKTSSEASNFFTGPAAQTIPELAQQSGTKTEKSASGKEPLFSFVNPDNVGQLIYLLKNEPAKNIATVINYTDPELSSQILNGIPDAKKKDVISQLSSTEELNSNEVKNIENNLKTRIDYLSGGEEKIITIIDRADEKLQTELLGELKNRNPQLAERVQKSIIRLEVISTLDAANLQIMIKQVGPAIFGQVLKTLSEDLQQKTLSNLPTGAATRLKQEMELGKPLTKQRAEIEKRRVLDIIRRMKERGLI